MRLAAAHRLPACDEFMQTIRRRRARSRRDRRRPVGRRRQRQGHRPALRAGRCRGPLPGRQQRRPHGRERAGQVRAPPRAVRHLQSRDVWPSSATAWSSIRRCCGPRSTISRAGTSPPRGLRSLGQGAPDHAVPHHCSTACRRRGWARARSAPPAAASARRTPTRLPGRACACRTCSTPKGFRERVMAPCGPRSELLAKAYDQDVSPSGSGVRRVPADGRDRCAPTWKTPACCCGTRCARTSACCSKAPRAPCSTSTTAPIPSSPPRTRWPAYASVGSGIGPDAVQRGVGDHARRTPPGWARVPSRRN